MVLRFGHLITYKDLSQEMTISDAEDVVKWCLHSLEREGMKATCYKKDDIPLRSLVATQPAIQLSRYSYVKRTFEEKKNTPIVIVFYGNRFYCIDGHTRSRAATERSVNALLGIEITPLPPPEYMGIPGVIRFAYENELKTVNEIPIFDDSELNTPQV